jgi:hypothetical protein
MAREGEPMPALPNEIDAELTLEIDGTDITPEKFLRGVRAFFGVLEVVTKEVCNERERAHWMVQVKAGSNLVGVRPAPNTPLPIVDRVLGFVRAGIETLEDRSEVPEGFPNLAIRHLRDLGKIVGTDERDDTRVRVWARRAPITVTHKSVAHAADLLSEVVEDYGSIEGRLLVMSARGTWHFEIDEHVWGQRIRCYIEQDLLEQALQYFRRRVEVYGRIKLRRDGTPVSIRVDKIVPFPERHELPDFLSVRGILQGQE